MPESKIHTILIIDDEVSLRNALCDKFTKEGFLVFSAKDGEEGLRVALLEKPDLILLDIVMPKMDGMTMLKNLRLANEWAKSVHVILISNLGADDEKIMREIGEDKLACYLVKSNWSISDLVKKIKDKLSNTA